LQRLTRWRGEDKELVFAAELDGIMPTAFHCSKARIARGNFAMRAAGRDYAMARFATGSPHLFIHGLQSAAYLKPLKPARRV
jgi:hypothetical protein